MWFGNLVTMRWFDDVWMKEVFANFLAAKIVEPVFPNIDHRLRFLVAHLPAAYAIDRTAGTHPIRQALENLNDAGSLYGPLIYHKAPIVIRQLERMMGADRLREGLRSYLEQFAFGNATWLDLLPLLARQVDRDVGAWSHAWVEHSGRPTVRTVLERGTGGLVTQLALVQSDPQPGRSLRWTQPIDILIGTAPAPSAVPVECVSERTEVPDVASLGPVELVLPGGTFGYGEFVIDEDSRTFLLQRVGELSDPLARAVAWMTLWEDLLGGRLRPQVFLDAALRALPRENTEQNVQLLASYVEKAFWRFLTPDARETRSQALEQALRDSLERAESATLKATCFSAFRSIVTTQAGVRFLERVWRRQQRIAGLTLGEPDEATLALDLAVRDIPAAAAVLQEQSARFSNADRRVRFEFVAPALSAQQEIRDAFFASLAHVHNRRHEPWVIEGMTYLNHPLRAAASQKYLRPAMELLSEIRDTGDIFFPKNWLDATLNGHSTRAAADEVRRFLAARPDYPLRLRQIILQSADALFRAADILSILR